MMEVPVITQIEQLISNVEMKKNTPDEWLYFSNELYTHFDSYQEFSLQESTRAIDCRAGCSFCCNHWVEDVYFFESIAISDYIYRNLHDRLESIKEKAALSEEIFEDIYEHNENYEEVELLQEFYKRQIPCPLLNEKGECMVYPVRPITCRGFFSESVELYCDPVSEKMEESGTYMILPPENIENRLDELHLKYGDNFPLSLRSMLAFML